MLKTLPLWVEFFVFVVITTLFIVYYMIKDNLNEAGFEAGVGGQSGTVNYGNTMGTFSSPDVSQNSANFDTSNNNKALGSTSNLSKSVPNSGSMANDLNAIYSKSVTPGPDEIITGIKYELSQQIKKDKQLAKQKVLTNLRKDPKFYSGLKMLNISDEDMVNNMTEQKSHPNDNPAKPKVFANAVETKKIFEELAVQKSQKYVVNSKIVDAMKESWKTKEQRSSWKNNPSK